MNAEQFNEQLDKANAQRGRGLITIEEWRQRKIVLLTERVKFIESELAAANAALATEMENF